MGTPEHMRGHWEAASLDELFERFEGLPSADVERTKTELLEQILAALAPHAGNGAPAGRALREAMTRVRMLSAGAEGFDMAVLELIDTARERLDAETRAAPVPSGARPGEGRERGDGDEVDEASKDSFPASDPPAYMAGGQGKG